MKTYVFFGDSVTEGCFALYETSYGFDTYREPTLVYHALLKPMLEARGEAVNIVNAGISGDNSFRAQDRLDQDVLAHHPDTVVVCFGLNDALHPLERYDASLRAIFARLTPVCRVIFITPNMLNTYVHPKTLPGALKIARQTAELQNNGSFDRYMDTARKAAADCGVELCDWYADWKAQAAAGRDTTEDLINYINHPSPEKHRELADKLFPMLI